MKSFSHLALAILMTLISVEFIENAAVAQEKASVTQAASEGSLRSTLMDGYDAPTFGDFRFNVSLKSTNTAGRLEQLDTPNDRRFRIKEEYSAGTVHSSGWGLTATAVTSGASMGDERKSSFGAGDPSVIIVHPPYHDDGKFRLTGQIRRYFAVSDRAQNREQQQYSYYLTSSYRMARGWSTFNQMIPRYFFQGFYKPEDTTGVIEDFGGISKQTFDWLRIGFGAHLAMEWHRQTPTGTYAEVFPFATFTVSRNISIEPRIYLPIQKTNNVNESARAISINNTQAELYAQISI